MLPHLPTASSYHTFTPTSDILTLSIPTRGPLPVFPSSASPPPSAGPTASRSDLSLKESCTIEMSLRWSRKNGAFLLVSSLTLAYPPCRLCDLRTTSVEVSIGLDKVDKNQTGDFVSTSLARVMNTPSMNKTIVRTWLDRAGKFPAAGVLAPSHPSSFLLIADRKSTLIFCVDIAHVDALTQTFRKFGVDARFLTGKTHANTRKELVASFKAGEFPVLINCGMSSHRI